MDGIYVLIPGTEDIIYYDSVYDYLIDRVDDADVLDLIDEIEIHIDISYYGRALPSTVLKKFNIVEAAVEDYLDVVARNCEYGLETEGYLKMSQFDSINGEIISYDQALLNRLR